MIFAFAQVRGKMLIDLWNVVGLRWTNLSVF